MKLLCGISDFGPVVRNRRKERGKSLTEVAAMLGVPRSTLQRVESGKTNPTWDLVLGICQALDLQPVLIPRERVRAVEAVVRMTETSEAPPLAGEEWS